MIQISDVSDSGGNLTFGLQGSVAKGIWSGSSLLCYVPPYYSAPQLGSTAEWINESILGPSGPQYDGSSG